MTRFKGTCTTLKHIYLIKRSLYLYNDMNFPLFNVGHHIPHADITFLLYPMRL